MGGRSLFFPSPYLFLFISFRPFSLACSPMITDNAHHDAVERRAEKGGEEEWSVAVGDAAAAVAEVITSAVVRLSVRKTH